MIVIVVYVDIHCSDRSGIKDANEYLWKHFVIKHLGRLVYLFEIEITFSRDKVYQSLTQMCS